MKSWALVEFGEGLWVPGLFVFIAVVVQRYNVPDSSIEVVLVAYSTVVICVDALTSACECKCSLVEKWPWA